MLRRLLHFDDNCLWSLYVQHSSIYWNTQRNYLSSCFKLGPTSPRRRHKCVPKILTDDGFWLWNKFGWDFRGCIYGDQRRGKIGVFQKGSPHICIALHPRVFNMVYLDTGVNIWPDWQSLFGLLSPQPHSVGRFRSTTGSSV